jgi:rhodanese-related sulfurtransferase
MKRVLLEAVTVTVFGLVLALVANGVSPRGLSLSRNYFPTTTGPSTGAGGNGGAGGGQATNATHEPNFETVAARLREKGLQAIEGKDAAQLFHDPQYELEGIVFVDARDDRHYQDGHVPGAYQFDRYYPEKHLPTVLPPCLAAAKVVVYCTGGSCEDSEFAALALKDAGVPADRLMVYIGGMTEWATNGLPVEIGARKSGTLRGSTP